MAIEAEIERLRAEASSIVENDEGSRYFASPLEVALYNAIEKRLDTDG